MVKNKLMPTIVLTAICIIVALVLSVANMFTSTVIEEAQKEKEAEALRVVYPSGESFDPINIEGRGLPASIAEAYAANDGGYVFKAAVAGYKSGLVIMIGVDGNGAITDTKWVESQETNGAEDSLNGAYNGKSASDLEAVIVGGSTKTSNGYHKAVRDALEAFEKLKGDTAQ